MNIARIAAALLLLSSPALAQNTNDPFPTPINTTDGVITVNFSEFAVIPDVEGGEAPRMNTLVDEPGTRRLFVNTMRGQIYSLSYDGKTVTPYLDINAANWGVSVNFQGSERGFQSIAFHPQFSQRGTPGYGKFYTYTDTSNMTPKADFSPSGTGHTHDTVLLEWTAKDRGGRQLRRRRSARVVPRRPSVCESQRRPDRVQPARACRQRRTSACSTSALPMAAAAAIRTSTAQNLNIGVREDPADRSARQEQRERPVRHPDSRTRSSARARRSARSTLMACATRSASRGTPRPARCTSPISARTSSKRSAK